MVTLVYDGNDPDKIINIDEYRETKLSQVVCLECHKRWLAIRSRHTKLIDLQCPKCGKSGTAIETGEELNMEIK